MISAIYLDLKLNNSHLVIGAILNTYDEFSKVSALVNNDTKTVFATKFNRDDPRFLVIRSFLVDTYNSDVNNFKYAGDEIKLLGHNIPLSIKEAGHNNGEGYLCTSLRERLDKVQDKAFSVPSWVVSLWLV